MCGISGIFYFQKNDQGQEPIKKMTDSLSHRGPDADGIYDQHPVQLGHRRLAIIDLDTNSDQPFYSHNKRYVMVFNGEVYNFKKLKQELSEYTFETDSDTEVVIAAYQKWGKSCVEKLEGMFAFAVLDKESNELFIARDRLGIKPLYYHQTDDYFLFSSEIRSLLNSDLLPRRINKTALSDYLRYQTVHTPDTLIEGVKQLHPGSFINLNEDDIQIRSYWKAEEQFSQANYSDPNKTKEAIKNTFFQAVEKRLVADVPYGAFLSGGIDSSAIVAAMSEVGKGSINSFSVVFDETEFSEEKYANLVAEKFKTNHQNIRLNGQDLLNDIPNALSAMDHPSGDGINTYIVSKATKSAGITVALSGLGGDELFSGYPIFRQAQELNGKKWLQSWPKGIRKFGGKLNEWRSPSVKSLKMTEILSLDYYELEHFYPISRQLYFDHELKKILKSPLQPNKVKAIAMEKVAYQTAGYELNQQSRVSVLEFSTYMQNVLLRDADQMSMAHALEIRVPFLDHKLVELALNIPEEQKLRNYPKSLFVESLGELLPKEVYERKKMGFVLPWDQWLKKDLRKVVEDQLLFLSSTQLFNAEIIQGHWKDFLNSSPKMNWVKIWSLVVLSYWIQHNNIQCNEA